MSKIYENIKWLCKQNGVAIADIEKPKNAGLISRYERREAILELPLWVFLKVSKTCKVSLDDIAGKDLQAEAELAEIRREIERLKELERALQVERIQE